MAHQMMLTLSDQEYNVLKAKATKSGKQIETMLHEIMVGQLYSSLPSETVERPLTGREFMEQQYREGKLLNVPTRRRFTQEEQDKRRRLARAFAGGKSASDMVIEDRGPY